jgi:hypothetical protein
MAETPDDRAVHMHCLVRRLELVEPDALIAGPDLGIEFPVGCARTPR